MRLPSDASAYFFGEFTTCEVAEAYPVAIGGVTVQAPELGLSVVDSSAETATVVVRDFEDPWIS